MGREEDFVEWIECVSCSSQRTSIIHPVNFTDDEGN